MATSTFAERPSLSVAERRDLEAGRGKPVAPQAPQPPQLEIQPPWPTVQAFASCNGFDREKAKHTARQDFDSKLQFIRTIAPTAYQAVEAEREIITAAHARYHEGIESAFTVVKEIEKTLMSRETTLKAIAAEQSALADAVATLAGPSSLELAAGELLVLEQRKRFLPGKIQELQDTAANLEETIRSLSTEHEVSVSELLTDMGRRCRSERGVIDAPMHATVQRGFP